MVEDRQLCGLNHQEPDRLNHQELSGNSAQEPAGSSAQQPVMLTAQQLVRLTAQQVVGRNASVKEPKLDGGRLFWLEQRPQERGRTTLLMAPAGPPETGPPQTAIELSPGAWNLRTRVHEYGGGSYAVAGPDLVWVHDGDRCLWHLALDPASGKPTGEPRRLTPLPAQEGAWAFADGLIDPARQRWIGVLESEGRDQLVAVPLAGGPPEPLHRPADFCGYAVLSPDAAQLAWIEWQQPCMPWQRSSLWLADLGPAGELLRPRLVAGSLPGDGPACSVFQPLWIGPQSLVVASDASGWWNLQQLDTATGAWVPLLPMAAEFAMPQWVYGMRTTAWDGQHLIAAACRDGAWELGRIEAGQWRPLGIPYDDLAELSAADGRLVAVASNPTSPQGLLELNLRSGRWCHRPAAPCPLPPEAISVGEPLWFAGHGGQRTHAWFYPPQGGAHPQAPLLVRGHSGPTGMARRGLSLAIQYWTCRGWGVVDVNYGGSTGFGRAYRERLDGQWGVGDVADCAAAAEALVRAGCASPERIAIEGGSAGGYTALAALCFTDRFRAGASRYGVADLSALARDTHRFEAHYLDGLVGPWPAASDSYAARSPLLHAQRIRCPVIFFQGLEDRVVPPAQTDQMAAALAANGIEVMVHRFAGEGHGFRSGEVQSLVLEATEAFFSRHFGL